MKRDRKRMTLALTLGEVAVAVVVDIPPITPNPRGKKARKARNANKQRNQRQGC